MAQERGLNPQKQKVMKGMRAYRRLTMVLQSVRTDRSGKGGMGEDSLVSIYDRITGKRGKQNT